MAKTFDVIEKIEEFAPLNLAEDWDNSGWQIDLKNKKINKIMLCLSVTDDVVNQAISEKCDMILSHHPMIFHSMKKIANKTIIKSIQNNIQIYSAHTNLDKTNGGITDYIGQKLGLKNPQALNEFVRVFEVEKGAELFDFVTKLKLEMNIPKMNLINGNVSKELKTIAICAGSGGSFISELKNSKIDLYITGDVKYHEALEAKDLTVADIGHFNSEKFVVEIFKNILQNFEMEIVVANEKNIWETV